MNLSHKFKERVQKYTMFISYAKKINFFYQKSSRSVIRLPTYFKKHLTILLNNRLLITISFISVYFSNFQNNNIWHC